jgi:hypothetical protein
MEWVKMNGLGKDGWMEKEVGVPLLSTRQAKGCDKGRKPAYPSGYNFFLFFFWTQQSQHSLFCTVWS